MVHVEEQDVLLIAYLKKRDAQQRAMPEVKGPPGLVLDKRHGPALSFRPGESTEVDDLERWLGERQDHLARLTVRGSKGGSKGFMAAHDLV